MQDTAIHDLTTAPQDLTPANPIQQEIPSVEHKEPISIPGKKANFCQRTVRLIKRIAEFVFIGLLAVFCFWANPTIFAVSFTVGLVQSHKVNKIIRKIERFIKNTPPLILMVYAGAAFLALPVSLAVFSALYAAKLGATFNENAKAKEKAKGL